MKLIGKAMIAHKKSADGSDVVILCGSFTPRHPEDFKSLLGDTFNIALLDIDIKKGRVKAMDKGPSPEDFLVRADEFDWKDVLKTGKEIDS